MLASYLSLASTICLDGALSADQRRTRMSDLKNETSPISDGVNARPRNESIGQSAGGLPNDSSHPIEVDDAEVERVKEKLTGGDGEAEVEAHPS
jgi:hypothetical protein